MARDSAVCTEAARSARAPDTTMALFSGFAVHGSHALLEFRTAVEIHEVSAWLLMLLWV